MVLQFSQRRLDLLIEVSIWSFALAVTKPKPKRLSLKHKHSPIVIVEELPIMVEELTQRSRPGCHRMYRSAACVMMALVLASVAVEGAAACSGSVLTLETLELAMGGSCHRCEEYLPHINTALQEAGMDCPLRIAAFLAEARHETAGFKYEVLVLWSGHEFWLVTRPLACCMGLLLSGHGLLACTDQCTSPSTMEQGQFT